MKSRPLPHAVFLISMMFSYPANADCSEAREVWADVKSSQSVTVLQGFQSAYSDCAVYSALANDRLVALGATAGSTWPITTKNLDKPTRTREAVPEMDKCLTLTAGDGQHPAYEKVSPEEFEPEKALEVCLVAADPKLDNSLRDGATGLARVKSALGDFEAAFDLLQEAVAAGNHEARRQNAVAYQAGLGVARDMGKGLELMKQLADDGFAPAMADYGITLAVNPQSASDQAAQNEAAAYLARAYRAGRESTGKYLAPLISDPKNSEFDAVWAVEIMEGMVDQLDGDWPRTLATYYLDGHGEVAPDADKGLHYVALLKSRGLKPPFNEAEMACMQAAGAPTQFWDLKSVAVRDQDLDIPSALTICSDARRISGVFLPEIGAILARVLMADGEYEQARELAMEQVRHGTGLAMYVLGKLNEADSYYANAADWYLQSTEAGFGLGMEALGDLYWEGLGVPQSEAKALELFERAAIFARHVDLQIWLGEYYGDLSNDLSDEEKAEQYLKMATSQERHPDFSRAMTALGQFYLNRTVFDHDYAALAFEAFNTAVEFREGWNNQMTEIDPGAYMGLARMYIEGIHVERNTVAAVTMLRYAANAGETGALMSAGMILEAEGNLVEAAPYYLEGCKADLFLACSRAERAVEAAALEKLENLSEAD